MIELTEENFDAETKSGRVLVDFWATWCGVCKMIKPKLDEAEKEHTEYKFCTVDVDQCANLANKLNITNLPTIVLFENGKEVKRGTFEILNHLGE